MNLLFSSFAALLLVGCLRSPNVLCVRVSSDFNERSGSKLLKGIAANRKEPMCCKCSRADKDGKPVYSCSDGGSCRYCKQFGGQARAIMKPAPAGGRCAKGAKKGAHYDCRTAFESFVEVTKEPNLSNATRNSIGMPTVGFGTYQFSVEQAEQSVGDALKAGFRLIDSAEAYQNEEGTGRGIKASGVPREELFVITKVFPGYTGWGMPEKNFEETIAACRESLRKLQLDYVDLYLIHGPFASTRLEQYKALLQLKRLGLAKHIGVSNYNEKRFKEIEDAGLPLPEVNEIEFHPINQQQEITEYMANKGIVPIAYSSLATLSSWRAGEGQGGDKTAHLKKHCQAVTQRIAKKLGVTEAKLLLRWGMQRGYVVLTKSSNPARIQSNINLFDFKIPAEDMATINGEDLREAVAWAANGLNPMQVETPLAGRARA